MGHTHGRKTQLEIDDAADMAEQVRDVRTSADHLCPRCGSNDVTRWGWQHGRQRYRCQDCGRTFSDMTATPAAYTKRLELWDEHLRLMASGVTAPVAARQLGVSARTVRRWQRRVLSRFAGAYPRVGGAGAVYMVRPNRHLLLAVDDHGQEWIADYAYMDSICAYEELLRDRVLPGSVIIARDWPHSPLAKAAARVGMRFLRAVTPGEYGPPSDLPARQRAEVYVRWVRRFRGNSWGHRRSYLDWHTAMQRAGDADGFVAAAVQSWLEVPDSMKLSDGS